VVGVADRDRCAPVAAARLGLVHLQKGIRAGLFGGFSGQPVQRSAETRPNMWTSASSEQPDS
jgi:hypothetical protein